MSGIIITDYFFREKIHLSLHSLMLMCLRVTARPSNYIQYFKIL